LVAGKRNRRASCPTSVIDKVLRMSTEMLYNKIFFINKSRNYGYNLQIFPKKIPLQCRKDCSGIESRKLVRKYRQK